jgi:pimeloyl-ACP methyl ester carboxylesterase
MRRLVHHFRWSRLPRGEMTERMRTLRGRMLVVLGGVDRLVRDAPSYVMGLRDAGAPLIVRVIPAGGHAVNEERPDEVLAMTMTFLRGGIPEGAEPAR